MRVLTTLLLWLLSVAASAQVGKAFLTVEALVCRSKDVHVGILKSYEPLPPVGGSRRQSYRLVVKVDETIKGTPAKELSFVVSQSLPEEELARFVVRRDRFLWTSGPSVGMVAERLLGGMSEAYRATPDYYFYRLFEPGSMERYVDFDSMIFTADLRVISSNEDLFAEARRIVKKHPGVLEITYFGLPDVVAKMCDDPNAGASLAVPKTPEVRSLANELIRDPAAIIGSAIRRSKKLYIAPQLKSQDLEALRRCGKQLLERLDSGAWSG